MKTSNMQLSKALNAGPRIRMSMLGNTLSPLHNQMHDGADFDKDILGVGVFISGMDKWGNPRKRVGR